MVTGTTCKHERAPATSNNTRAGCGPFLYCPPGHRRAYSDAGAERARRSASPPRTARAQGSRLGYGTGTAARKVHERLYFNADEIRARKAEQRQLRCADGTARPAGWRQSMALASQANARGRPGT